MADYQTFTITAGQWTKVASGVVQGAIHPLEIIGQYFQKTKNFGSAAPTNGDLDGAVEIPFSGGLINSSDRIDVYVTVVNTASGKVRLDP